MQRRQFQVELTIEHGIYHRGEHGEAKYLKHCNKVVSDLLKLNNVNGRLSCILFVIKNEQLMYALYNKLSDGYYTP